MKKQTSKTSQFSIGLRLFGGSYLVYLAWSLRDAMGEGPLYLAAVAVFGIVGAVMLVHSGIKLYRHDYEPMNQPALNDSECEESEDE